MKKNAADNLSPITTADLLTYTSNNLIALLEQHNLTQKELAAITGVAEATISDIKNKKKFPTIDFLFTLKARFNISIDDFITKNISPIQFAPEAPPSKWEQDEYFDYQKYSGTYFIYYLDTGKYKGRDYNTAEESLMFGVLHIYEDPTPLGRLNYSCVAILGLKNQDKAEKLKSQIEAMEDTASLLEFAAKEYGEKAYYGDFELSRYHAFLSMTHQSKDKLLAIFHRVPSDKPAYNGGIGTVNSVSRGRESMPVVQFIGILKNKASVSCEEIHHNLLLNYPNFKADEETEDLIRLFKSLYLTSSEYCESLTELQKTITIKANLERYIKKNLERNMFRYGKISNRDDDDWYHALTEITDFESEDEDSTE